MDLRDRLKAMGVRPRVPGQLAQPTEGMGESEPALADDRRPTTDDRRSRFNPQSSVLSPYQPRIAFSQTAFRIDQALPGSWHDTADGPCFAVEKRFPVAHQRGPVHLGSVLHTRPSTLWDVGRASVLR